MPEGDDGLLLGEGGQTRVGGVTVARREGRRPERHHGVAHVLVEDAAPLADGPRDHAEVAVEQVHHGPRGQLLGHAAEALDVREEHRDRPPLGRLGIVAGGPEERADDARIEILPEGVLDALLGLQLHHHVVERAGQLADLVPGGDRQLDAELAGLDGVRALQQAAEGAGQAMGQHAEEHQPHEGGQAEQDAVEDQHGDLLLVRLASGDPGEVDEGRAGGQRGRVRTRSRSRRIPWPGAAPPRRDRP